MFKRAAFRVSIKGGATGLVASLIAFLISSSPAISVAFGCICVAIPTLLQKYRSEQRVKVWSSLWPEILDQVVSGLQSGMSTEESLASLGTRGPDATRSIFIEFGENLRQNSTLAFAISQVKKRFANSVADQVCEVLILSKGTGSRDTSLILRTLADHLRADIVLREEIEAKQSWIRNSAVIAAVAPWLLLLVLSTQTNTIVAYKSGVGYAILAGGIVMTGIAFIWMNRVAQIEVSPRVFPL
jgi:tight adherence protein B